MTALVTSELTDYDTGDGWWLGITNDEPAFSMRAGDEYIRMKPSTGLEMSGALYATNARQTFEPLWSGFGVGDEPAGDFAYIDLGVYVLLWSSLTALGISNATTMTIMNLPAAVRPSAIRQVSTVVVNDGLSEPGYMLIGTDGSISWFPMAVSGSRVVQGTFSATGVKGWAAGNLVAFPK